jgi:RNA polymerase sigma-54 factor
MKLGLQQSARMEQRLIQSPQMIQAMQILQLSAVDLQERIEQELTENPFLEVVEPEPPEGLTPPGDGLAKDAAQTPGEAAEARGVQNMLDELERYERDFSDNGRARARYDEDGDKKLEAMQNTPDQPKSLAEALLEQLAFLDLDERGRALAEYLIYSLDHRGYLEETLEEIAAECAAQPEMQGATVEELAQVLAQLRNAIHPGLGARDLRECFLLQLDASGVDAPLVRNLVQNHLEDITTNRLPRIAKATGRSMEDVKQAIDAMRGLDPSPGGEYGEMTAAVILPDVTVEEIDGKYEVRLNRQRVPELTLSPTYRQLLSQAKKGDGVQEWVKKRVESARWFIDAIQQRQSTLQRIANKIFERQRDFLDKGVRGLKPLRMQEIADDVGVHISTVSRAVSGKYAQTPRGTFPLKYFFTGGTPRESGGVASQASIKQRIAELVRQEDPTNPFSDDQLAELLEQRDRVKIARRTVTKYRKALAIPSSSQRRVF